MGSAWWQCAACLRTQEEDICELQLNHCNLYDVPPDVFIYERTLEKLYLDANRIKDLPRPLFQCHELRVLSLSDNEVSTLPPAIASLINLEYLDLSKNSIKELPDSIKECKSLRSIDISVNPFDRFPDAITHIVGLRELYINDAYIEYLPANFGRLSALKTLELRENNMMTLPKSMSRLVNLQRLDIGNNDFTELPEVVGDLINLTELWIDGNDIRRIPANVEQLYRLNHFDCTMNAIHMLPMEIRGWRDISIMNLSSNEMYELPDTLCYLRTIVTLKIDDNQLNALPNDIGQMSSLEELIVTKNFLEYLPSSIGLLRKLHCLNADNNYLRALPAEIGSCTALSLLSLRSNNLARVPPELGHLSSLRVLNLVNNCIKFLPVSMLNLNNLKALWLSDNQSQPLVPLQQEFNCEEDMMVLSCFMLPQKPRQDLEQMAQSAGPISSSIIGTGKRICFAAEVDSEVPRQLHRAPTPYPKELRNLARHARNLHHQSIHDQRSAPSSATSVDRHTAKSCNKSNRVAETGAEHSVSEESSDEANKTVLAKEKSPDIREAKYIRNPTSDYLVKAPTVADYVNSTWKPDEYSKANTARIVESDKFIEPYKTIYADGKFREQTRTSVSKPCDVPPVPPPYHIAAAFSKKAALFQQFNNSIEPRVASPSSPFNSSSNSAATFPDVSSKASLDASAEATKVEERASPPDDHRANLADPNVVASTTDNATGTDSIDHSQLTDQSYTPVPEGADSSEQACENDRALKPSKIPVLKAKHIENSTTSNSDISVKRASPAAEEEANRTSLSAYSSIPTSPITGKKYRSPLSTLSAKPLDRPRKMTNGNVNANNNSCDNVDSPSRPNLVVTKNTGEEPSVASPATAVAKSETNSGRDTPNFNCKSSGDADSAVETKEQASPASNETLHSEKKPRFKWMFGPHKNANVLNRSYACDCDW
ncbi:PREDICTED: leucine-rich repeat-containing protein 1 isoform X2 [Dinoponera quadriceps]|uniref:Leucine-rich repeat-containing protein 1 isoform X2 n=1 Tax=Dinoponera quadriceps TaxID=609295 RepID=A0A6P3X0C9_DINQU|nr:PREDICTED: leucine-rich repeat-containing protein 1 isoform X2 [Dinoponera quadriceps]